LTEYNDNRTETFEHMLSFCSIPNDNLSIASIDFSISSCSFVTPVPVISINSTVIDAQENQVKSSSFLSDVAEELEVKFNKLLQFMAMISQSRPAVSLRQYPLSQ
jgi:hypothetical protein